MTVLVAAWQPAETAPPGGPPTSFVAHLHGRNLVVARTEAGRWLWRVVSPHGALLAAGDAPSRLAAERAAEDEAMAVHPPTRDLLDQLLS